MMRGKFRKINEFKLRYLKQLSTVDSLKNSWDVWGEKIEQIIIIRTGVSPHLISEIK